ncbi:MAG: Na+/H+ antiporter subunit E [Anaerolineales bacterium]|nr:Na+/H+ antiporter subunit E [Anaerolineales bacterium]
MNYLGAVVLLWFIYLGLTMNFELNNIVLGGLVAFGVTALIRPKSKKLHIKRLPIALLSSIKYTGILLIDMFLSGVQVAGIVFHPRLPIKPGIIAIPSLSESELSEALSAHAITVTPGEIVIEIDEHGNMYTHCLIATESEKKAEDAQRLRINLLQNIFP